MSVRIYEEYGKDLHGSIGCRDEVLAWFTKLPSRYHKFLYDFAFNVTIEVKPVTFEVGDIHEAARELEHSRSDRLFAAHSHQQGSVRTKESRTSGKIILVL